jgi:nitrogen fixation NifU-like protein
MTGDLSELYQSLILDHNRAPRNFRVMEGASRHAEGYNPLCGDSLSVWLKLEGDRIADASFQGSGCAISKASASLMTTVVKGKTKEEAGEIFASFQRMVTVRPEPRTIFRPSWLSGVREYPARGSVRACLGTR